MRTAQTKTPADAAQRRAAVPVIVYTVDRLPAYDRAFYEPMRRANVDLLTDRNQWSNLMSSSIHTA